MYLLDANVLIDANRDYYPIDRVPEFWDWLADIGRQGLVKLPLEIYEEVIAGREDRLTLWLKDNRCLLVLDEFVQAELVAQVVEQGYGSDLTDDEIEKIGQDPFLIAYALASEGSRVIVTTEVSRPSTTRSNRRLPDVCRGLGVDPINTFELVRRLDFRTGRTS